MDPEAEIVAWKLVRLILLFLNISCIMLISISGLQLADLSSAEENFAEAAHKLEQARRIAEKEGLLNELRRIHCLIGVAYGTLEFRSFVTSISNPEPEGW